MTLKKVSILFFLAYILVLMQTGFFAHYRIFGITLNFVLVSVVLVVFLEKNEKFFSASFWFAVFSGFFSDIFSSGIFGFQTVLFAGFVILFKLLTKRYVRIPFSQRA